MKIGKFIALVKERPLLYDSLHPLYKDRKEKEKKWREISTAMNIHCDVARSRWKSLKDCYTKYLKSTMASGPRVYLKYINWQWANHMEFMKPHIKFGLIISNIEIHNNQETDDVSAQPISDIKEYQSSSELQTVEEICEIHDRCETPDKFEIHEESEKFKTQEISGTRKKPKRHQTTGLRKSKNERERGLRRPAIISPETTTTPNTYANVHYLEDKNIESISATELIFLGYAKTIKTFSIRRQAQVKIKIAKIMMEEEIANFEETLSHNE